MNGLRLGGADYFRTDLMTRSYLNDKGKPVGSAPLWCCRQCGAAVWYMNLHDGLCPKLSEYENNEQLDASRAYYR